MEHRLKADGSKQMARRRRHRSVAYPYNGLHKWGQGGRCKTPYKLLDSVSEPQPQLSTTCSRTAARCLPPVQDGGMATGPLRSCSVCETSVTYPPCRLLLRLLVGGVTTTMIASGARIILSLFIVVIVIVVIVRLDVARVLSSV